MGIPALDTKGFTPVLKILCWIIGILFLGFGWMATVGMADMAEIPVIKTSLEVHNEKLKYVGYDIDNINSRIMHLDGKLDKMNAQLFEAITLLKKR